MTSLNKIMLIGNIGKEPEMRALQNGNAILTFNLATTKNFKKNDNWENITEWHSITFFGKNAEYLNGKLKKGMQVFVSGELKSTEKETNGVKVKYWNVIGDEYIILEKSNKTVNNEPTNNKKNNEFIYDVPF